MDANDISHMSDEELLSLLDEIVRRGNCHDRMDDDTVLYQQVRVEVGLRMSQRNVPPTPVPGATG